MHLTQSNIKGIASTFKKMLFHINPQNKRQLNHFYFFFNILFKNRIYYNWIDLFIDWVLVPIYLCATMQSIYVSFAYFLKLRIAPYFNRPYHVKIDIKLHHFNKICVQINYLSPTFIYLLLLNAIHLFSTKKTIKMTIVLKETYFNVMHLIFLSIFLMKILNHSN